jgi:hypothetical protein
MIKLAKMTKLHYASVKVAIFPLITKGIFFYKHFILFFYYRLFSMEAALHQETTVTVSNEVSEIPIMPNDYPADSPLEPF